MAAVVANLVVVSVAVTCRVRHLAARRAKGSDGARPPARSRPLRINEWLRLHLPARINMRGRSCTEMHASAADGVRRHSQRAALRRKTTSTIAPSPIASARCTAALTGTR